EDEIAARLRNTPGNEVASRPRFFLSVRSATRFPLRGNICHGHFDRHIASEESTGWVNSLECGVLNCGFIVSGRSAAERHYGELKNACRGIGVEVQGHAWR